MKIHALTTGAVRVKHSFLFPSPGARRQLDLFLPGEFSDPLPIHCWAIEHDGVLRLVDTGETAAARNVPFARMEVTTEQELPAAMAAAGLSIDDVAEVVLTHAHGDHIDGLVHVRSRVLIHDAEMRSVRSPMARVMRRALRQPLPPGFAPETFTLDGGPFGAFPRSRALSSDGRIMIVDTAGHTPGHVSVICVDDSGRHVLLAGDATDSLEQLHARRADAVGPDPKVHVATLDTILAHCARYPTVYLPSHDPDSLARHAAGTTVDTTASPMHAVVVNVTINDPDEAERALREQLVPRVSQLPGFVTGYWTVKDDSALTMLVFESKDAADRMSGQAEATVPPAMTFRNVEVREVAAYA